MSDTAPPQDAATITTDDIRNLLNIVDAAAKRGAFSVKEFTAIGELYSKVDVFLSSKEVKAAPTTEPAGA